MYRIAFTFVADPTNTLHYSRRRVSTVEEAEDYIIDLKLWSSTRHHYSIVEVEKEDVYVNA